MPSFQKLSQLSSATRFRAVECRQTMHVGISIIMQRGGSISGSKYEKTNMRPHFRSNRNSCRIARNGISAKSECDWNAFSKYFQLRIENDSKSTLVFYSLLERHRWLLYFVHRPNLNSISTATDDGDGEELKKKNVSTLNIHMCEMFTCSFASQNRHPCLSVCVSLPSIRIVGDLFNANV